MENWRLDWLLIFALMAMFALVGAGVRVRRTQMPLSFHLLLWWVGRLRRAAEWTYAVYRAWDSAARKWIAVRCEYRISCAAEDEFERHLPQIVDDTPKGISNGKAGTDHAALARRMQRSAQETRYGRNRAGAH